MTDESVSDIKEYINQELLPRIKEMRSTHNRRSRLFYVSAVISTALVLVMLGVGGYLYDIDGVATVEFGAVVAIIVAYGAMLHGAFHFVFVRGVRQQYVEDIVAPIVDHIRPGIEYRGEGGLSLDEFEDTAIAQLPVDDFRSRDLFEARIDNGQISFSEVEAACRVRKQEQNFARKQICYVLRGLFFSARLDRSFEGTTVIQPTLRRFSNTDELPRADAGSELQNPTVRPAAGWPHVDWTPENHPEPIGEVSIPDPEFHHLFDVYSTAIPEARNLFRPMVVERFKEIHSVWRSDVHRAPVTRVEGQGHFIAVIRDDQVFLARPMPRTIAEMRSFEAREQTELLVQFARDVRLGMELIEAL